MRSISVSTSVYAALWAARCEGEDDEDAILRRIFDINTPTPKLPVGSPPVAEGFSDPKHKVSLPEGFKIFRKFKGTVYHAHAHQGGWQLDGNEKVFRSLSDLSSAIRAPAENAWMGWSCNGPDGSVCKIGDLRDKSTVQRRNR